jgi:hypothetical protein
MLRKAIAVAMLCLTLLLCGLDTSAVGAPAEAETALHALVHGENAGARGDLDDLAAVAFVASVALFLVMRPPAGQRPFSWTVVRQDVRDAAGWRASAERGPPSLA